MEPRILEPIIDAMKAKGLGDPSPDEFHVQVHVDGPSKLPTGKMAKTFTVVIAEK